MALKTTNPMLSPLARAKGTGSAKSGTEHWISQQILAVALIPLSLYVLGSFLLCVAFVSGDSYVLARDWLKMPLNGLMTILLIAIAYMHGANGFQSGLIEDYVHDKTLNILGLLAVKFSAFFLASAGILSVLKVMLGA